MAKPAVTQPTVGKKITVAGFATEVRTSVATLGSWPACSVYGPTSTNVTTAGVVLAFPSERFDNATMHSTVTNTSRITVPIDGTYLVTATVTFDDVDAAASCGMTLNKNSGGTFATGQFARVFPESAVAPLADSVQLVKAVNLVATDYVETWVYRVGGASDSTTRTGTGTLTCQLIAYT